METIDEQYKSALSFIIEQGETKQDRTGTGTLSTSLMPSMFFDLRDGFPLLSWKFTPFKSVSTELFWFLSGDTRLKPLLDAGCTIWNGNAYDWYKKCRPHFGKSLLSYSEFISEVKGGSLQDFALGRIYGHQWRRGYVDQVQPIIEAIKAGSHSRRLMVNTWNVQDIESNSMALPPCHFAWQVVVSGCKKFFDLSATMRSADFGLGVPFNVASYALLAEWLAKETGKKARYLRLNFVGDSHIYLDHLEPLKQALEDKERVCNPMPRVWKRSGEYKIKNYNPNGRIQLKMSV